MPRNIINRQRINKILKGIKPIKIHRRWKIKKINGIYTCTTSLISQDHVRLYSSIIVHKIIHLVKTNSGIQIKTLIVDMPQHFDYTVTYKASNSIEDDEDDSSKMILNRVFWAFKPCIVGFQYCKLVV